MATPIPEKQPFQRERSFVETNFVQTPRTTNVTQIVAEKVIATPGVSSLSFLGLILHAKCYFPLLLMIFLKWG